MEPALVLEKICTERRCTYEHVSIFDVIAFKLWPRKRIITDFTYSVYTSLIGTSKHMLYLYMLRIRCRAISLVCTILIYVHRASFCHYVQRNPSLSKAKDFFISYRITRMKSNTAFHSGPNVTTCIQGQHTFYKL